MQVRRGLVLGGLITLAIAGCGGSDEPSSASSAPSTPAGLTRTTTKAISIAFPGAWSAQTGKPPLEVVSGEEQTLASGPVGSTGIAPGAAVGVTPRAGGDVEVLAAGNESDTRTRFPDVQVGRKAKLTVPGATGARLIESKVLATPTSGGKSASARPGTPGAVPIRQWDVVATTRAGNAVNLYIFVPEADVAKVPVQQIISSLVVR